MFRRDQRILLYISLALNGVFIFICSSWVIYSLISRSAPEQTTWRDFYREELDVSDNQWKFIKEEMQSYRTSWRNTCEEIINYRKQIINRLEAKENFDDLLEKIARPQKEMQNIVLAHIDAQRGILTEEQEKLFFERLRKVTGCHYH